jgi:hypothetical protein
MLGTGVDALAQTQRFLSAVTIGLSRVTTAHLRNFPAPLRAFCPCLGDKWALSALEIAPFNLFYGDQFDLSA